MPLNCDRRFSRNVSITRLDLLSHLDGFCLIVSVVKAQAHTTHIVSSAAFRNAAGSKKGSLNPDCYETLLSGRK